MRLLKTYDLLTDLSQINYEEIYRPVRDNIPVEI